MNTRWTIGIAAIVGIALVLAAAILVLQDTRNDDGQAPGGGGDGESASSENEPEPAPDEETDGQDERRATIEVTGAWTEPGECRGGEADTAHEQCHYIELLVEAPEDTDVDVTMMSWRAEDAHGGSRTPVWVDEPMQVFEGSSRTVTLWFDLDSETRLASVQHVDSGTTLQVPDYGEVEPVTPAIGSTGGSDPAGTPGPSS